MSNAKANNRFNELYRKVGTHILEKGSPSGDRTGVGTISTFGGLLEIPLMFEPAPFLTTKKINLKAVIGELLWFLEGSVDVNVLQNDYDCNYWNEWMSPVTGTIGPMYGVQWRGDADRPDQFARVVNELVTNPTSRRMIVDCWEVKYIPDGKTPPKDNPEKGLMALAPCHYSYQFNVRHNLNERKGPLQTCTEHGVSLKFSLRSSDYILGLPSNIASYYILLSLVVDYMNTKAADDEIYLPLSLLVDFGDAHIYQNHIEVASRFLKRTKSDSPKFETSLDAMDVFTTYLNKDFEDKDMSEYRRYALETLLACVVDYDPLSGMLAARNV